MNNISLDNKLDNNQKDKTPRRRLFNFDSKKRLSKKTRDYIFVIIMLLYPVLQFVITWAFVNINSLIHAFQYGRIDGTYEWAGFDQFIKIFDDLFNSQLNTTGVSWLNNTSVILINSLGFAVITIFISLPLSLLFSYFLSNNLYYYITII